MRVSNNHFLSKLWHEIEGSLLFCLGQTPLLWEVFGFQVKCSVTVVLQTRLWSQQTYARALVVLGTMLQNLNGYITLHYHALKNRTRIHLLVFMHV